MSSGDLQVAMASGARQTRAWALLRSLGAAPQLGRCSAAPWRPEGRRYGFGATSPPIPAQPIEPKQDSFAELSSNKSQSTFRPSMALIARQRRHSAKASRQKASVLSDAVLQRPGNVDDTVSAAHFFTVMALSSFITRLAILPLGSA